MNFNTCPGQVHRDFHDVHVSTVVYNLKRSTRQILPAASGYFLLLLQYMYSDTDAFVHFYS
jgi:hypothetical protein